MQRSPGLSVVKRLLPFTRNDNSCSDRQVYKLSRDCFLSLAMTTHAAIARFIRCQQIASFHSQ
ncbi:MAG: hypothetical protein HEQ20_16085 [Aphanizomenon flos-aquae KM1D3_PB]|nr:MAG: hypothetical protein HEQ20_16085 [Aphanizomenon flos-aquae KM1D3_PB]